MVRGGWRVVCGGGGCWWWRATAVAAVADAAVQFLLFGCTFIQIHLFHFKFFNFICLILRVSCL